jgi:dihydropyrimidinase
MEGVRPVTTSSLLLRGARRMDAAAMPQADILIAGGAIQAIDSVGSLSASHIIDLDGAWVMPGVIDAHTHPIHRETFATVGHAAPFGGVTTTLQHLYPEPREALASALERGRNGAAESAADFGFHLRITPERVENWARELPDRDDVLSVKVFLAHGTPGISSSLGELYEVMTAASRIGMPVIVHAEFGDVAIRHERRVGSAGDLRAFDASRPSDLEAACVSAVCALAHLAGSQAYIAHVSSALALQAAIAARTAGASVLVETCAHYLFLDHDAPLGGLAKCTPPLRSKQDRALLREAVAAGDVDVVASDHCGYGPDEKSHQVEESGNGLPGVELLLPLLLDVVVREDWLNHQQLARILCSGPADAFGLVTKGRLAPGMDADVVVIDPGTSWTVQDDQLHDMSFYSPYAGYELRGGISAVFRRGELLVRNGELVSGGGGRLVTRTAAEPVR